MPCVSVHIARSDAIFNVVLCVHLGAIGDDVGLELCDRGQAETERMYFPVTSGCATASRPLELLRLLLTTVLCVDGQANGADAVVGRHSALCLCVKSWS